MGKSRNKIAVIAAITTLIPTFAASQQGGAGASGANPGGLQLDFGISTGLILDDNFKLNVNGGGTSAIADTKLSFGLSSIGPVDNLSINGSGVVRFAHIPGRTSNGFESPDLRLIYARSGINSRFNFDARYRNADREFLDPFKVEKEEQQSGNLIGGGGSLQTRGIGVGYQTGLQAPLGFSINARHDERNYSGTSDPRLFDTKTDNVKSSVSFQVSQVTKVSVNAGWTHYTAEDPQQTDRTTKDLSLGLLQDINPVLVLNAQLGMSQIDTDFLAPQPSKHRSGGTSSVTLTQTLANGTVWGSLGSTLTTNGPRQTLRFGRDFQMPNSTFAASAGVTKGQSGSTDLVGSLSYIRTLQSSDFSVQLDRAASTNTASEDVLNTRLSVGYGYAIDNNSRVDLNLDWGQVKNFSANSNIERTGLKATYTRSLTADWNLAGGVQLRNYDEAGVGSARSDQLFVTLDRKFSFRP